jgi:hypothetical protein
MKGRKARGRGGRVKEGRKVQGGRLKKRRDEDRDRDRRRKLIDLNVYSLS